MDESIVDEMNINIDRLFDQIKSLDGDRLLIAEKAVKLWRSAKIQECVGGQPMETLSIYRTAYEALQGMDLDVSGLIHPYQMDR